MERIGFLINKLKEQYEKAESQNSLLVTLQMLYRELQPKIDGDALVGKISIVVPGQMDLSFLEKSIEQKFALDLTPNDAGKQVFELSVEPLDVSREASDVIHQSSGVNRESLILNPEASNVNPEPLDMKNETPEVKKEPSMVSYQAPKAREISAVDFKEPVISAEGPTTETDLALKTDVEPELENVPADETKPETIVAAPPIVPTIEPEKPIMQPEAISVNDRFHAQETLNSRYAIPDNAVVEKDKIGEKETNYSQSPLPEKDSRYMPPPPSKPEPTPVVEGPIVEVPTFTKSPTVATAVVPVKELHETISVPTFTSYNDKQEKRQPELFHTLKAEPLKDLKKAISINDRFQYINHLFMGDEGVYERSIKTINHFNVYSEAEFWIRRELSTKMGWDKDDTVVQQFMTLVGRRFA